MNFDISMSLTPQVESLSESSHGPRARRQTRHHRVPVDTAFSCNHMAHPPISRPLHRSDVHPRPATAPRPLPLLVDHLAGRRGHVAHRRLLRALRPLPNVLLPLPAAIRRCRRLRRVCQRVPDCGRSRWKQSSSRHARVARSPMRGFVAVEAVVSGSGPCQQECARRRLQSGYAAHRAEAVTLVVGRV